MYVRNEISNGVKVVKNAHDTLIWLKLDQQFFNTVNDLYVCGVYMWGDDSPANQHVPDNLFDILQDDINFFSNKGSVFVAGDFNGRVGIKPDHVIYDSNNIEMDDIDYTPDTPLARFSKDTACNAQGTKLLDLCKSTCMRIANGRLHNDHMIGNFSYANRQGSTVIDYLILNERDFVNVCDFSIEKFNAFSDHSPLTFKLCCDSRPTNQNVNNCVFVKWDDEHTVELRRQIISRLPELNRITSTCDASRDVESVNSSLNSFVHILRDATDPLFLRRTKNNGQSRFNNTQVGSRTAVWFDHDCVTSKHEYLCALGEFNGCKSNANRTRFLDCKLRYKRVVKRKRRQFELKKRSDIIKLRHAKPRDFWKMFSSRKSAASNDISMDDFFKHFKELSTEANFGNNLEADNFCTNHDFSADNRSHEELDRPITINDVHAAIKSLSRNKASSSDYLINEYFLATSDIIAGHLVDIFNMVYNSGHFPEMWTKGVIIPVYKKGSTCDTNNYRGITLVSCMAKLFTTIINKRLTDWCDENSVLTDAQFGFRKGRSTVDAIFVLSSLIEKTLNDKGRLYCAFVDLRKAFDCVNRNALWYKLYNSGIGGKMLRIARSMYMTVKSCVKHCGSFSDFF